MYFKVIVMILLLTCNAYGTPVQCDPVLAEQAPPQVRKVCLALSTIRKLSDAMESYIQDQTLTSSDYVRNDDVLRYGGENKRQDLDHVFLRFGRK